MFSKTAIKRPITTIMVMLIVILGGIVSYLGLNLDLMPSMDIPVAIVSTSYVGAGPEEIESLITKPLEEALGTVSNVDSITSTSSTGSSTVVVMFADGTDVDMAALDMREKVDMVKSALPSDASEPMVLKIDTSMMSSIAVGIKSDVLTLTEINTLSEDTLVQRFEKIEGIASVSVVGGIEQEIEITIKPEKMQGYGITVSQVSQKLAAENLNYPTGSIRQGKVSLQVRSEGKFSSIDEIKDLPINTAGGGLVHLRDIAEINLVEKDQSSYAIIDGAPAIMLTIQKQSNANVVDISEKIIKEMSKIESDYPQVSLNMLTDTASYITSAVNNITTTAVQAAVIAVLVVFVFLRSPKMALIVGVSIPTSIIATFAAMWLSGMTMNMISMGGVAIGIGMLVDNSIVVLENIFSYMKKGYDEREAAAKGANEVAMAVTASTLTTMGVFVPLLFISGTMGDVFKDLSLTICFALIASLAVSLTFVPMACSQLIKKEQVMEEMLENRPKTLGSRFLHLWGRGLDKLESGYTKLLSKCLVNKKKVVVLVIIIFIATLSLVPRMGFDFMPEMDEGVVAVSVSLPNGTVLEETELVVEQVMGILSDYEEVDMYYATIGGSGFMGGSADAASITLNLVDKTEREHSSKEIARLMENDLSRVAGCEITVAASSSAMGSYGGSGITVTLTGDESDILRSISMEIEGLIENIDGVVSVDNSAGETLPETKITINREKASTYGITASQIANAVSTAINGTVATKFTMDGTEIDVRIKQADESIKYISDLNNLTIATQTGLIIPITEVANISMDESSVSISRSNHHKYVDVTAEIFGRDLSFAQKDLEGALNGLILPDGYTYEFTGTLETMNESFADLMLVLIVAILLVYMIMASQFESLIYPFIVMFSMPIAITGGILGLFITGKSITVVAFMGFIMLAGMVVNNAIVLIDAANQNITAGMEPYDAILKAGPNRLRPILMTTLTTVLGMIPLGLALTEGMEMQQPIAITIIFGLSLSTLVTLIFIPVLYMLVEKLRLRSIRKRRKNKKTTKKEQNA